MAHIDPELLETLLNMSEGNTLDFKRDAYPASGANDDQKGEFIKDVLAFANGWKNSDAFILMGVTEDAGNRATVVGVQSHPDDAQLQQLVNGKTNMPVRFEYIPVTIDSAPIGVVRIHQDQDRPIFLKKAFGKLKAQTVYVRRGSSTAEADPTEVARMGAAKAKSKIEPELLVELANPTTRLRWGTTLPLVSKVLRERPPAPPVPKFGIAQRMSKIQALPVTPSYNRPDPKKLAKYRQTMGLLQQAGFWVRNAGGVLVEDVRLVASVEGNDCLKLVEDLPERPRGLFAVPRVSPALFGREPALAIDEVDPGWELTVRFKKIQPRQEVWSVPFWIGSSVPCDVGVRVQVFADSLSTPLDLMFSVAITTEDGWLDEIDDDDDDEEDPEDSDET